MLLEQVISGAQIGTDIAALRAARACGIQTGGFMPKGFRTTLGPLPADQVAEFGLVETESAKYPLRTEKNVVAADATLLLAYNWASPGEKLTKRLIQKHKRPSFGITLEKLEGKWCVRPYGQSVPPSKEVYKLAEAHYATHVAIWITQRECSVLNVAGNGNQEIEECVQHFLMMVFRLLKGDQSDGG